MSTIRRPLINVNEAAKPKAKISEKTQFLAINAHFERIFSAVTATQVINQRFLRINGAVKPR